MSVELVDLAIADTLALQTELAWRSAPHFYAQHMSAGRWKMSRWQEYLGRELALAIAKGDGRLIVNAPPRHGKALDDNTPIWTPSGRKIMKPISKAVFSSLMRNAGSRHSMGTSALVLGAGALAILRNRDRSFLRV